MQEDALDKLYFDPKRQRARNAVEALAVQEAFVLDADADADAAGQATATVAAAGGGSRRQIREWTLQGTELRQDLVPPSSSSSSSEGTLAGATAGPPAAATTEMGMAAGTESDLFRENQLINSWIERYRRDDPLVLPGDPDLGLNASQTKAIAMALGDRLSLIQGVRFFPFHLPGRFSPLLRLTLGPPSLPGPASRRRSCR